MNPVLNKKAFENVVYGNSDVMTINGVINKSFILWMILAVGAYLGWKNPTVTVPLLIPVLIISLILAFIIIFKTLSTTYFPYVWIVLTQRWQRGNVGCTIPVLLPSSQHSSPPVTCLEQYSLLH